VIKKFLAALGVVTAAGAPAIYAAAGPAPAKAAADAVAPTTSAQQVEDTIICPLTGEEISPCCCPVNGER
jgi:hypothetical protein